MAECLVFPTECVHLHEVLYVVTVLRLVRYCIYIQPQNLSLPIRQRIQVFKDERGVIFNR